MKTSSLLDTFDWAKYERVIALSPHLDDAALSCGGLLTALRGVISRLVVTIACGDPMPRDNGGKRRARNRRGHVAPALRRAEDARAMHAIECDFVHLGFSDCVFRRSPTSGDLIYRDARARWAGAGFDDVAHVEELYLVLRRLTQNMGRVIVLSPMSIGFHVDHAICARVAMRLAGGGTTLLFYEDFPYVAMSHDEKGHDSPAAAMARLGLEETERYAVAFDVQEKMELIATYETQLDVLFGGKRELQQKLASSSFGGQPSEFYWRARSVGSTPPRSQT